jgi:hypothetical protein
MRRRAAGTLAVSTVITITIVIKRLNESDNSPFLPDDIQEVSSINEAVLTSPAALEVGRVLKTCAAHVHGQ